MDFFRKLIMNDNFYFFCKGFLITIMKIPYFLWAIVKVILFMFFPMFFKKIIKDELDVDIMNVFYWHALLLFLFVCLCLCVFFPLVGGAGSDSPLWCLWLLLLLLLAPSFIHYVLFFIWWLVCSFVKEMIKIGQING